VRIPARALEQYHANAAAAASRREEGNAAATATVTTTAFGLRVGKFGLDYESSSTVLDPPPTSDERTAEQQARAFAAEAEVSALRASIGRQGADRTDASTTWHDSGQSRYASGQHLSPGRVRSALAAYAAAAREAVLPPGTMLAATV
jgi:hypothetical protein